MEQSTVITILFQSYQTLVGTKRNPADYQRTLKTESYSFPYTDGKGRNFKIDLKDMPQRQLDSSKTLKTSHALVLCFNSDETDQQALQKNIDLIESNVRQYLNFAYEKSPATAQIYPIVFFGTRIDLLQKKEKTPALKKIKKHLTEKGYPLFYISALEDQEGLQRDFREVVQKAIDFYDECKNNNLGHEINGGGNENGSSVDNEGEYEEESKDSRQAQVDSKKQSKQINQKNSEQQQQQSNSSPVNKKQQKKQQKGQKQKATPPADIQLNQQPAKIESQEQLKPCVSSNNNHQAKDKQENGLSPKKKPQKSFPYILFFLALILLSSNIYTKKEKWQFFQVQYEMKIQLSHYKNLTNFTVPGYEQQKVCQLYSPKQQSLNILDKLNLIIGDNFCNKLQLFFLKKYERNFLQNYTNNITNDLQRFSSNPEIHPYLLSLYTNNWPNINISAVKVSLIRAIFLWSQEYDRYPVLPHQQTDNFISCYGSQHKSLLSSSVVDNMAESDKKDAEQHKIIMRICRQHLKHKGVHNLF